MAYQAQGQQQQYAPPQGGYAQPQQAGIIQQQDSGSVEGISYHIAHRDTNTLLVLQLQPNALIKAKPGAMIHMSTTVAIKGSVKFSMKKMFTGGEMTESAYTGPGELALAPSIFGDITPIHINGHDQWNIGRDAFLACTNGVVKETKSQGLGKALFSGEGLFLYRIMGQGILFVSSFGAITRKDLRPGETHIVDNGHLVAWNCNYTLERVGSTKDSVISGEGRVCKFTGPGTVYIQTRNPDEFISWAQSLMTAKSGYA